MENETDAGPALEINEGQDHAGEVAHSEVALEEGPIPLLQPAYFDNLIFWAVLALVSVYLILTRTALPRISQTLAQREGTIGSDLAAAESLRAQAQEAQASYDRALAEARAEANRIAQEARDAVQADLDRALAQAEAQIDARAAQGAQAVAAIQAQAQDSVALVARDVSREILRALGGRVDEAALDRALAQRMGG